jgi:hypothetical protein
MVRKAQTATEYLIILAVVIIIALIVVGVMGGIPGMGGNSKMKTSAAYWSTARIALTSYAIRPTGVNLSMRNNEINTLRIDSISLDGTDLGIASRVLTTGETAAFNSDAKTCVQDTFSYTVIINYTDVTTGGSYTFTGDGQTLDGTCAES